MIVFRHETLAQEPLFALLMPFYEITLSELITNYNYAKARILFVFFETIALKLLSAASRFLDLGFAHCDIKPENITIHEGEPVIIDLGSVVSLNNPALEITPFYSLDADDQRVSPEFDLFCIITTLMRCSLSSFELQYRSKSQMISFIETSIQLDGSFERHGSLCLKILKCGNAKDALDSLLAR